MESILKKKTLILILLSFSLLINQYYGNKGDLLILVSSSGQSKNHLKVAAKAKFKKFSKIVTLTGFKKNNPLSKKGHINFWIDSKKYNHLDNTWENYNILKKGRSMCYQNNLFSTKYKYSNVSTNEIDDNQM